MSALFIEMLQSLTTVICYVFTASALFTVILAILVCYAMNRALGRSWNPQTVAASNDPGLNEPHVTAKQSIALSAAVW